MTRGPAPSQDTSSPRRSARPTSRSSTAPASTSSASWSTAEKLGVVEKSGTWYSYDGARIGQGRDKMLAHLDEHPAMQQQLRDQLIKQARAAAIAPSTSLSAAAASAAAAAAAGAAS